VTEARLQPAVEEIEQMRRDGLAKSLRRDLKAITSDFRLTMQVLAIGGASNRLVRIGEVAAGVPRACVQERRQPSSLRLR
jgi:hypothetical protein